MLLSWKEMQATELPPVDWHIEELLPADSVALIWGAESVGKTPVCWYMMRAVGAGEPFFGLPTVGGKAVFIELDMPLRGTKNRTKELAFPDSVKFYHGPIVASLEPAYMAERFAECVEFGPKLVVVDSLRKAHPLDDKASETPSAVYGAYQRLFPGATLLFIHHERKSSVENRPDNESYTGSRQWIADAQIAYHVKKVAGQFPIRLTVYKNQAGEKDWSLHFHLDSGWLLTSDGRRDEEIVEMAKVLTGAPLVAAIQEKLGCSRMTVYRKLKDLKRRGLL